MGYASGDLSASGVARTERMISWVDCSRSWVRRMPKTALCRIFGSIRRGSSSLEIIFRPRPVRRLTNCFRNCRRPLLRWVLSGLRSASRLFRGTSPKLGMRPKLTFRLASTAPVGRALGCDCRGSGGQRRGLMRAENRCTTIRSFLSSVPCMATQSQVPCGTHTWGPS